MTNTPTLGERIRRARERARLTQEELAAEAGASVRAVGDWENDRREPRNRIGVLEEVLGVSLTGPPEPGPAVPSSLIAAIRRALPPEDQERAIAALEESLRGAPEHGASAPSEPSRRAG